MFKGISHVRVEGGRLLLSKDGQQVDDELEGGVFQLRATSLDMIARTSTEFENSWQVGNEKVNGDLYVRNANYIEIPTFRPVSVAERGEAKFNIHATMALTDSRIYGFHGEHFVGQAGQIFLHVSSADHTKAAVAFQDGERNQSCSLNISVQLKHDLFQSTFRPLWLGNQRATVDILIGICGFQHSHESLSDFGETQNVVMASGVWSAELRSIMLSTACSA